MLNTLTPSCSRRFALGNSRTRQRSGYLFAVVGAAVAVLIKGQDWSAAVGASVGVTIVTLLIAVVAFRRRQKAAAYKPPRPTYACVSNAGLPTAAVTPFLPAAFLPHTTGVRLLCAIGAGLLAASAVTAAGTGCDSSRR